MTDRPAYPIPPLNDREKTVEQITEEQALFWAHRREILGDTYVASMMRRDLFKIELTAVRPVLEKYFEPGDRILDFGCGDGRFRETIEATGAIYEGVDIIPGISTIEWDGLNLPRGYDGVLAAFVLQHLTDSKAYAYWIHQLHRCLNPGGGLVVVDRQPFERMNHNTEFLTPRGMVELLDPLPWRGAKNIPIEYPDHWLGIFYRKPLAMPKGDAPTFRTDEDGKVWAEMIPMPDQIAVTAATLEEGVVDRDHLRLGGDGDRIIIECENGRWVYYILGAWGEGVIIGELEEGMGFE